MMQVTFADGMAEEYENEAFAGGGQAEIHLSKDKKSVVKLYTPSGNPNIKHRERILTLLTEHNAVARDAYWSIFLAWPEKLVDFPRVGFRMRLVEKLRPLADYIYPRAYARLPPGEKGWLIGHLACALHLATVAQLFASMGLCYGDFSYRNILIDPFIGKMILIDCDSLAHQDRPDILPPVVTGTSWCRAPELVARKVEVPSVLTDRHALAVILYNWFLLRHPLVGKRVLDEDSERDDFLTYGEKALYIEHPTDATNRPLKSGLEASMLGKELETLFLQAFVTGLHTPSRRPQPYLWQEALYKTLDRIIPCTASHCRWRGFIVGTDAPLICPMCKTPVDYPRTLPFLYLFDTGRERYTKKPLQEHAQTHYVVGWPGRSLHRWHTLAQFSPLSRKDPRYDTAECALFELDGHTHTWYLKNLALPELRYSSGAGQSFIWRPCPIGSCLPLVDGMVLQFGRASEYARARIRFKENSVATVAASSSKKSIATLPKIWQEAPWPTYALTASERREIGGGILPTARLKVSGPIVNL